WVNECAFVSIVQTRPCPTFGRPVHRRSRLHRLRPGTSPQTLRIPPRGGHPALRITSARWLQVRLGCIRLSPSCPCGRFHTFRSPRPARRYPRFWIWRSSFERQSTLHPPEQRTPHHPPRTSPPPSRLRPISGETRLSDLPCSAAVTAGRGRFLQLLGMPLSPCCPYLPRRSDRPHRSARGLSCCLRPEAERSAPGVIFFRGHHWVH